MTTSVLRALDRRGVAESDRARLLALFSEAEAGFRQHFNREPDRGWWVPGRLEVFGKHTDYAGGRTLIGTVPRGFAFVAASRRDAVVRILDARQGESATFDSSLLAGQVNIRNEKGNDNVSGWAQYVVVVLDRFLKNFPEATLGGDICFVSDLPAASGASSSSALTVGTALAVARLNHLDDRPEWRVNLPSAIAVAGYLACVENGLTFGSLEGGGGVGTHSGSEDHTAMLCCRPGLLSQYSFVPVHHIADAAMPEGWAFVVATSGVMAEKAGRAQTLYNRASLSARALLEIWNARSEPETSLAAALRKGPEAELRLRDLIRQAPVGDWSIADLDRRLSHFVAEDRRVPEAMRGFAEGDHSRLADLAAASQDDANTLLQNQIDETNALAELARRQGAFAACAFGAGFGGSVWALVDRGEAEAFGARWMRSYRARFVQHDRATWFAARPSVSLIEI